MNTAEIITKAYDDLFSLNNSNKDFDFVGWVIKTSWLIYFRSVKFHYVEETNDASSVAENCTCCSISAQKTTKKISLKICWELKTPTGTWKLVHALLLCKWATRTRQTCLSKTFANSPNKQKLSKQVLVMIKHCLGNSQINSIPAWSKEFLHNFSLQNTEKQEFTRQLERTDIIHSQREIK